MCAEMTPNDQLNRPDLKRQRKSRSELKLLLEQFFVFNAQMVFSRQGIAQVVLRNTWPLLTLMPLEL